MKIEIKLFDHQSINQLIVWLIDWHTIDEKKKRKLSHIIRFYILALLTIYS